MTEKEKEYWYKAYQSTYSTKEKELAAIGVEMYVEEYTPLTFDHMLTAAQNMGIGSSTRERINWLVGRQATELTEKQAHAYIESYKARTGITLSLGEVYRNTDAIRAEMEDYNRNLKEQGLDSYQRAALISSMFFGSP